MEGHDETTSFALKGKTKADRIQELVQMMKNGRITKTELFLQLSQLQRKSKLPSESSGEDQEGPLSPGERLEGGVSPQQNQLQQSRQPPVLKVPASSPGNDSMASPNRALSTAERRAMIIQKLFEEKRRQNQQQRSVNGEVESASPNATYRGNISPGSHGVRELQEELAAARHSPGYNQEMVSPPRVLLTPRSERARGPHRKDHDEQVQMNWRPVSATKQQGVPQRSSLSDSRLRKLQQELISKQMEECTFRPKIRGLPEEYGIRRSSGDHMSFYERNDRWSNKKSEQIERRRMEKAEEELEGCTFTPAINRNTRPSTPDRRYSRQMYHEDDVEDDDQSFQGSEVTGGNAWGTTHERLYQQSKQNKLAEKQARARAEEEERLRRECTFKPDIAKTENYAVRPRYLDGVPVKRPSSAPRGGRLGDNASIASTVSSAAQRKMAWEEDLTFSPQTNPIHPSMQAAQVYLSKDIVSRLTQPRDALYSKEGKDENDNYNNSLHGTQFGEKVIDVNTFLSTAAAGARRPSTAPRERPNNEEPPKLSKEEARERRRSFEAFLVRQAQQEKRKEQKIQQVAKQNEDPHKPTLCAKSVDMAKQKSQGTFLQRVARGALRKEQETVRAKSQCQDPECTFQPRINDASKRLASRSVVEMSRGDSLKKETKARLMKLRLEQEELQALTFSPELNKRNPAESRLKILSEPETYIRRIQQKNTMVSHKKNKAAQEQEMKELEECTFKPKIHDSPAYVKRIVRSLALAKPARDAQAASVKPDRPDWK